MGCHVFLRMHKVGQGGRGLWLTAKVAGSMADGPATATPYILCLDSAGIRIRGPGSCSRGQGHTLP
eukprot:84481-Chlamydomonas_euryale.AAC.1